MRKSVDKFAIGSPKKPRLLGTRPRKSPLGNSTPKTSTFKTVCIALRGGDIDTVKEKMAELKSQGTLANIINEKDSWFGQTLLHLSAGNGYRDLVEFLCKEGADPNCQDQNGNRPLHAAAGDNFSDCAQTLLDNGADVNAVENIRGDTALHTAVSPEDFVEIAKLFVNAGADLNIKNRNGVTPLMKAAESGSFMCVEHLLKSKAEVDLCDENGNTALHHSVAQDEQDCVQLLLKYGASKTIENNDGKTAFDD
eukprot:TRINITY_DN864_c0_g1_i1.p1 TRINITY_DN864_c0_g1~~TRINITY_DN864_c0_g1_i1.p1  ORF type:complete len:293 (+),score=51.00 TRINITY_DN864_c0_g1_i1:126-881(+)